MSTPRLFAPLLASAALFLAPAALAEIPNTKDVTIEIAFDAGPEAAYASIRQQAWQVCKPELGSPYPATRNSLRRACQQRVIADVMKQLAQTQPVQLATTMTPDAN